MRAGLLLLPELWQSCGWDRDSVDVGAAAPAVGNGVGVALGALEDLVELVEAVLVAVLT